MMVAIQGQDWCACFTCMFA